MSTPISPFLDHAAPILSAEPAINDQQREQLWDVFNQSKDANELAAKLAPLAVPDPLKHKLWSTKQAVAPVAPPLDNVAQAAARISQLDPQVRETAESHPNLLKAFTTAATAEPKSAQEPAGETSAAGKGTKAPKVETPAATPLAPRPDGQPHFPAIPNGHKRLLGSDGSVYDVPEEQMGAARDADPLHHILNPDEG